MLMVMNGEPWSSNRMSARGHRQKSAPEKAWSALHLTPDQLSRGLIASVRHSVTGSLREDWSTNGKRLAYGTVRERYHQPLIIVVERRKEWEGVEGERYRPTPAKVPPPLIFNVKLAARSNRSGSQLQLQHSVVAESSMKPDIMR